VARVRAADFITSPFGRATRRPGDRWAFDYYLPSSIPRTLSLDAATVAVLAEASVELGGWTASGNSSTTRGC